MVNTFSFVICMKNKNYSIPAVVSIKSLLYGHFFITSFLKQIFYGQNISVSMHTYKFFSFENLNDNNIQIYKSSELLPENATYSCQYF